MDLQNLHHVGRSGKPWGNQGELGLHLDSSTIEEVLRMGWLFVEIDGQKVPFRFLHLREHPRMGAVVKFEDVDDPQSASALAGCEVFAPPGHVADEKEEDDDWRAEDFIGMQVKDEEHGALGEVVGLEGSDDNPVLVVRNGDQEVLVPCEEHMIVGIDMEQGFLIVRTPPGLVELYRNG